MRSQGLVVRSTSEHGEAATKELTTDFTDNTDKGISIRGIREGMKFVCGAA
jgi:hypothetical protein